MKKRLTKSIVSLAVMICVTATMALMLALPANALSLDVYVRGVRLDRSTFETVDGVICVALREFAREMTDGEGVIAWESSTSTATIEYNGATVAAKAGEMYITANGRYFYCGTENYIRDGAMMVSVEALARSLGAKYGYDESRMRASVTGNAKRIESGDEFYDAWELFWLSRIISAESRGEPLVGKIAVGTVIYNRVASDRYPDSVYNVIFDMRHGVQFSPAYSGSVYRTPTDESVVAAKLCMDGARVGGNAMYFCTTEIMYTSWAGRNRPYLQTIGNHAFFA